MYVRFGDYKHAENEVAITYLSLQRMFSPRNQMAFLRKTLTIQGDFCTSGSTALTTAIKSLERGYLLEWETVGLFETDGTATAHVLWSGHSLNGIRLLTLDYPTEDGADYVTGRPYRAVFQADYVRDYNSDGKLVDIWETNVYAWEESITVVGDGGPDWELIPQFMGPPVLQVNAYVTPIRMIQSGQAIGLVDAIAYPQPPYWPEYLHHNRTVIERGSCQKKGRGLDLLFPLKWTYHFSMPPVMGVSAAGLATTGFAFTPASE